MKEIKNNHFENIFKMSPDLFMISTLDNGTYMAVNNGFTKLLGYSEEEVIHKSAIDLGIWADINDRHKVMEEIKKNGVIQNFESNFRAKNGTIIPVLLSANIIDIDGIPYFLGTARHITDRKQAEEKLIRSENELKKVQKIIHVGSWYLDVSNNEVHWTEELYKMYGFDPTLPVPPYTEHQKLFTPESWNLLSNSLAHTVQTGIPYELELRTIRLDGSNGWMWVRGETVQDKDGKTIGLWGAAQDITDRITIQEKEKENHKRLNLAMQVANMAWWEMNIQSGSVTFDQRKVEMLGYTPDKFATYHDFMALVHPDDYENTMNAMRKHMEGITDKYEVEYRIMTACGEYKWFRDIGSIVMWDEKNKPLMVTGLVIDISMDKAAEASLSESEKRFHDLFSSMMEGFAYHQIVLDQNNQPIDYIFLEMNHSFEKLTGFKRDQTVGKKVTEVIPGIKKDSTDWIGIYGQVALSGKGVSFESYSASLNKWYKISAYSPKPGYFATLIQDITERKQAEKEINTLNETLELKVQQRTAELESSMEAMRSFSYSISHDLRAPLRAIDGFSAILASKVEPILEAEDKRLFSIIRDNVKRMNLLILGLLELAKVSHRDIEHYPINMGEMVQSVYEEIVSEDDKARIHFKQENIVDCVGDPILIKQVWTNLIENAVKFSRKEDNPSITITSCQDNNQITYSIQDNGAGFNPEYKNKLFVAFSRLHGEEEYKGTGIGLVLVERIIQRHSGQIWAEGEEGQGATFYFSLPIVKVEAE